MLRRPGLPHVPLMQVYVLNPPLCELEREEGGVAAGPYDAVRCKQVRGKEGLNPGRLDGRILLAFPRVVLTRAPRVSIS